MSQAKLEFEYAQAADRGARPYQEDTVGVWRRPEGGRTGAVLAVLSDGMGGHVSGETASRVACARYIETFKTYTDDPIEALVDKALTLSNDAIESETRKNPNLKGMGCTLVAGYIDQSGVRWASVGDSALHLYRQGKLYRLNEDHSLGALLDRQAAANLISAEDAKNDPRRRTLRSALIGGHIMERDIGKEPERLVHGDWVILASDGLETLTGDEISEIINRIGPSAGPKALVDALLKAVLARRVANQDNVSIIAVRVWNPHDGDTHVIDPGGVPATIRRRLQNYAATKPAEKPAATITPDITDPVTETEREKLRVPEPRAPAVASVAATAEPVESSFGLSALAAVLALVMIGFGVWYIMQGQGPERTSSSGPGGATGSATASGGGTPTVTGSTGGDAGAASAPPAPDSSNTNGKPAKSPATQASGTTVKPTKPATPPEATQAKPRGEPHEGTAASSWPATTSPASPAGGKKE